MPNFKMLIETLHGDGVKQVPTVHRAVVLFLSDPLNSKNFRLLWKLLYKRQLDDSIKIAKHNGNIRLHLRS